MKGYLDNIEEEALANKNFRQVLYTGQHAQLVLMSLEPKEDIGEEVHEIVDQFIRIEEGEGKVVLDGEERSLKSGSAIIIPAGTKHNVINTSDTEMKLYTVYSPAHHKDGTVHKTKADAEKDTEDHI
ncbi:cupin domain-containing protein [Candidatus Woesebacteria bacterium]|nr:cupin domain-containing protein [Candidatus Woesebacteria bacterium]